MQMSKPAVEAYERHGFNPGPRLSAIALYARSALPSRAPFVSWVETNLALQTVEEDKFDVGYVQRFEINNFLFDEDPMLVEYPPFEEGGALSFRERGVANWASDGRRF